MNENKKNKVVIKTLLFLAFTVLDVFLVYAAVFSMMMVKEDKDITYAVESAEKYYYEQNFSRLIDTVDLYDFYNDDMKVYKEACDAYVTKMQCRIYLDSGETDMYKRCLDKLNDMKASCMPQNTKLISQFIEEVQ